MKPCFGYIRVSTVKQGEGVSLDAQKDAIADFASRNDLEIVKWFEEKQTAAKSGRPVFNQMLKDLKRGRASGLIMHKIDRSARNLRDWAIVTELPDMGIDVFIATESLDFRSRGGRLTADIQAVIAADYIRNLREESKKGLDGRLKQGIYPFMAPVGYLNNGGGKPKTLDPVKAPLVREMFERYASGQYSLRSLHAEINKRGLRNRLENPLSLCGVETIINNPFYTGLIVIKRTGKTYEGVHEPLISSTMFKRVQDIKSGRSGKISTRQNHLFRGLFRCGHCDGPMTPERQKGRVYYRCHTGDCATTTAREDRLEAEIVETLLHIQISPDQAKTMKDAWAADKCAAEQNERRSNINLQMAKDTGRLDRLLDLFVDGAIDEGIYNTKKRSLEISIAARNEELSGIPNTTQIEQDRMEFLELMKSLAGLYLLGSHAEKREIVENAFSNRKVVEKQIDLEPYDWLQPGKMDLPVFFGAHYRDTSRTFASEPETKLEPKRRLNRLIALLRAATIENINECQIRTLRQGPNCQ